MKQRPSSPSFADLIVGHRKVQQTFFFALIRSKNRVMIVVYGNNFRHLPSYRQSYEETDIHPHRLDDNACCVGDKYEENGKE